MRRHPEKFQPKTKKEKETWTESKKGLEEKREKIKEELKKIPEKFHSSYLLLREKEIIKNPSEFTEWIAEKVKVRWLLKDTPKENLEFGCKIYQVRTPEDLEKLAENDEVIWLLGNTPKENLEFASKVYQIKTPKGLKKLAKNSEIRWLLGKAPLEGLKFAFENKLLTKTNFPYFSPEFVESLDKFFDFQKKEKEKIDFLKTLIHQYSPRVAQDVFLEGILEEKVSLENKKELFSFLEEMKGFSPLFFKKYQSLPEKERKNYLEKIKSLKKDFFKNKPVEITKENKEEIGELIYLFYRPIEMSRRHIMSYLGIVPDRTADLKDYSFPEEGYEIKISPSLEMKLKEGKELSKERIDFIFQTFSQAKQLTKEELNKEEKKEKEKRIKDVLIRLAKASPSFERPEDYAPLFSLLEREEIASLGERKPSLSPSSVYPYLGKSAEASGTLFKDYFEKKLKEFLKDKKDLQEELKKQILKHKIQFEKILKKEISPDISSEEISSLLSSFAAEKPISYFRGLIKKEIKKFESEEETKRRKEEKELKLYLSKNIPSFFAKASAGICTARDIELFKRKDHFHLNLTEKKGGDEFIVGNIQGYFVERKGRKGILLRGINPTSDFLYEVHLPSLLKEIFEKIKEFAEKNNLSFILLSEQLGPWHALSNRAEVYNTLKKQGYLKKEVAFRYEIAELTTISKAYPLWKRKLLKKKRIVLGKIFTGNS